MFLTSMLHWGAVFNTNYLEGELIIGIITIFFLCSWRKYMISIGAGFWSVMIGFELMSNSINIASYQEDVPKVALILVALIIITLIICSV